MTFLTWFRLSLALAALVWSCPAPAAGDAPVQKRSTVNDSNLDKDEREQALELMRKGSEQYKSGNYAGARASFLKSYELRATYDVACSLAQTNVRLDRTTEALPYYDVCVDSYPVSGELGRLEKIRKDREEALGKVGVVRIEFAQEGVEVLLKDKVLGVTPLSKPLYLEPGVHSLVFKANEHRQMSRAFRVVAGERHLVAAEFETLPSPKAETPTETQKPEVVPQPAPAPVDESAKHNWIPAYVLGGVTVATLASSIALRLVAGGKKDKGESLSKDLSTVDCQVGNDERCSELASLNKTQRSLAMASDLTLIVSGVGAAATIGYVIYELMHTKKSETTAQYKLRPDFGFAGNVGWMSLSGTF